MRHAFLVAGLLLVAACVDVPESVRAEFAGPSANERSHFRPVRRAAASPEPRAAERGARVANDQGVSSPTASTDAPPRPFEREPASQTSDAALTDAGSVVEPLDPSRSGAHAPAAATAHSPSEPSESALDAGRSP